MQSCEMCPLMTLPEQGDWINDPTVVLFNLTHQP